MKATELRGRTAALRLPPAANYSETSEKKRGNVPFSGPFALPGGGRDGNMNGREEENASEDEN